MAIDAENTGAHDAHDHGAHGAAEQANEADLDVVTPVIVDLGKVKRKHVKRLKRGQGRLAEEVLDVVDEVADVLGDELDGSTLVPVVLIYERKPKQNRRTIELPF